MKTEIRRAVACAALCAVPAVAFCAAEGDAKPAASPNRMAACAQEAKGLKGEEREKFMSRCLKGPGADVRHVKEAHHEGSGHEQRNRMKSCNEQAGRQELKGDERRAFMSACLRG